MDFHRKCVASNYHIDICVATYRRPELLDHLLFSLAQQETKGKFSFAVNLVDNDPSATAEPIVAKYRSALEVRYAIEPIKNISRARNKAIQMAKGDYVAIIDDDEWAASDWLFQLFSCAESLRLGSVVGIVNYLFPKGTSSALIKSGLLSPPAWRTGKAREFFGCTNNCLIRRSALQGLGQPFRPEYGISGGEDTDFFVRFRKAGNTVGTCERAHVFAPVHSKRNTLLYALKRKLFVGERMARIMSCHFSNQAKLQAFTFQFKISAGVALLLSLLPILWLVRPALYRLLGKITYHLGYVKWFYWPRIHQEYA